MKSTSKAIFYDMQDDSNPLNGRELGPDEAVAVIAGLRTRPAFMCELTQHDGATLDVGVARNAGIAQYAKPEGKTPAQLAVLRGEENVADEVDFLCGDTPTTFIGRNLIPLDALDDVIREFVRSGGLSRSVDWEAV